MHQYSCLCFTNTNIELRILDENYFFPKESELDFMCNKGLHNFIFIFYMCSGDIYHMKLKEHSINI